MRAFGTALCLAAFVVSCGGDAETRPGPQQKSECDRRGINPDQGRTGRCVEDNYKFTVVNRGDLLEFRDWAVKLNDYATAKTLASRSRGVIRADGTFVVFDVTVTNKLDRPATFDEDDYPPLFGNVVPSFALSLGDSTFRQSSEAVTGVIDACFTEGAARIQSGAAETCKIIFDLARSRAANLTSRRAVGNLMVFPPGERDQFTHVGTIRLYR